jgi:hypothetical protein
MLKEMWPAIAEMTATEETQHIQNAEKRKKAHAEKKREAEANAQIISKVPHSIQGTFLTDDGDAWFTLQPEHMRINPEDLAFKHGSDLPGEWHMLGIVDALPDSEAPDSSMIDRVNTPLEEAFRTMLSMLRFVLGRPINRYGITPIMIFRTMRPVSHDETTTEDELE